MKASLSAMASFNEDEKMIYIRYVKRLQSRLPL